MNDAFSLLFAFDASSERSFSEALPSLSVEFSIIFPFHLNETRPAAEPPTLKQPKHQLHQVPNPNRHHAADLAACNGDGETALHLALRGNDRDIALALIGAKCPVDASDTQGASPLHLAVLSNQPAVAQAKTTQFAIFSFSFSFLGGLLISGCWGELALVLTV